MEKNTDTTRYAHEGGKQVDTAGRKQEDGNTVMSKGHGRTKHGLDAGTQIE